MMLVWLALHLVLCWAAALPEPKPSPKAQLDAKCRRQAETGPLNIDLTVWRKGDTELQWSGDIALGNPPQNFNVVFDTGAPFILLPDKRNCTTCGEQHTHFDPSASSTFSGQPGSPVELGFGPAGGGTVPYDEHQGADCTAVTDTLRIADRTAPEQQFLICHFYSQGLRDQPADGIFGLNSEEVSAWAEGVTYTTAHWNLVNHNQLPSPVFGFSFIQDPGMNRDGVLTLGGTDPSLYHPDNIQTIPLDWELSGGRGRWVFDLHSVHTPPDAIVPVLNSSNSAALLDTGAAMMVTPDEATARDLYGRISPLIQPIDSASGMGVWGAPCDVLDSVAADVSFKVGNATEYVHDLTVAKRFFNVGEYPGQPGVCQAVFAHWVNPTREPYRNRPVWLVGSPLFRSYYTIWNSVERTIGFARPVCGGAPECG